jgi:pimeloyl-ACP methyl ester carboxylesterase
MRRRAVACVAGLLAFLCAAGAPIAGTAPGGAPTSSRAGARSPAPRVENRTLSVFGVRIHYLEAGRGSPVILLHGAGGSADSWRTLMPPLARGARVLAPDQVGFGGSDKPPIDYTTDTLVDFLVRFMAVLGIDRASLVGHATGARVACLFALAHPDRVDRLVLVSGTGHRPDADPEVRRALNFSTLAGARRLLELAYFNDPAYVTDDEVERTFSKRLHSGAGFAIGRLEESYKRGEGFNDDLGPIKAPTLIVWGEDDEIASISAAHKAERQIHGARLVTLPKCGHLPMVEAKSHLERTLREFLQH